MQNPAPGRLTEIENASNRLVIHPTSRRLVTVLARLGVHPNVVSVSGAAFGVFAGIFYYRAELGSPLAAVAGLAAMLIWHVFDGADGQLARLTGKTSRAGKIVDGLSDYAVWTAIYIALAMAVATQLGAYAWGLTALAALSHVMQAAVYERQREHYTQIACQRLAPVSASLRENRLVAAVDRFYMAVQRRLDPWSASSVALPAERLDAFRATFGPLLRYWSLMGANTRTLLLFLCAVSVGVQAFLVLEIVVFNAVFLWLAMRTRHMTARFRRSAGVAADMRLGA